VHKTERSVAVITGVAIIFFAMFLVLRNEPFASPDLARIMRIILSLGIGILGASIPGFLKVQYNFAGIAVRAGGALALFVLTYFGSPHVDALNLKDPEVVAYLQRVDFRTRASPREDEGNRRAADMAATLSVSIRNRAEPARTAFLKRTEVRLHLAEQERTLHWQYFVNMHEEAEGVWLGRRLITAGTRCGLRRA